MDLFEAIEGRASVRSLKSVEIPREDLMKILEAGRRAPSGKNIQPFQFIVVTDRSTIRKLAAPQAFIAEASALIAIVADPRASTYWLEDVSAAAAQMLLAIHALGYASVWVEGTLLRKEQEMKRVLGVPDELRLMIFLPIGAPASAPSQAAKKSLDQLVRWEKY
jgi:nitroreductase